MCIRIGGRDDDGDENRRTTTTIATSHVSECNATQINIARCLNGGTCGVLPTGKLQCQCTIGWEGVHCEMDDDPIIIPGASTLSSAATGGILIACVVVVVIFIVLIVFLCMKRFRRTANSQPNEYEEVNQNPHNEFHTDSQGCSSNNNNKEDLSTGMSLMASHDPDYTDDLSQVPSVVRGKSSEDLNSEHHL